MSTFTNDSVSRGYTEGRVEALEELVEKVKSMKFNTGREWFDFDAALDRCIEVAEQLKEKRFPTK